jgi:N-acetylglucosaminyl-diphospho-decaprenol L-rhamnosyltransferase
MTAKPNSAVWDQVWTIVVHHRNRHTLLKTIESLQAGGIAPTRLLIVDNSEVPMIEEEALRADLPPGVELLTVPNRGFAAAVNEGIVEIGNRADNVQYVLVATHEVIVKEGAIVALLQALSENEERMAAGPTLLVMHGSTELLWSCGGYLSSILRLPRHRGYLESPTALKTDAVTARDWLDGALVLYRWSEIETHQMDESYFLYLEEVDYHLAIRARGGQVVWVPSSTTYQASNGMPLFYLARNLQIFHRRWGRTGWCLIPTVYVCSRALLRGIRDGTFRRSLREVSSGYRTGRRALRSVR